MSWDLLSVNDIDSKMNNANIIMVDVREEDEYNHKHIKGMINIPSKKIYTQLDYLYLFDTIIICCERGNIGMKISYKIDLIFGQRKKVYNIFGGIEAYRGNNFIYST